MSSCHVYPGADNKPSRCVFMAPVPIHVAQSLGRFWVEIQHGEKKAERRFKGSAMQEPPVVFKNIFLGSNS